jgi:hypothetical protein
MQTENIHLTTPSIKGPKQKGNLAWAMNREGDFEQFTVEDVKMINGHRCLLIDGKYVSEKLTR